MFTGLIETLCTVKSLRPGSDSMRLGIDLGKLAEKTTIGDSIAVDGVCLTVAKLQGSIAEFDISGETLEKTTLGELRPYSQVNVEPALRGSDRFGGHFVLGHIDGTGTIKKIDRKGKFQDIIFSADKELLDAMVVKGSVAVDGISLTVAEIDRDSFRVAVIPETLRKSTLGKAKVGQKVNIETDMIIKTVNKQLKSTLGSQVNQKKLTAEKLKDMGF